jgi:predicted permease
VPALDRRAVLIGAVVAAVIVLPGAFLNDAVKPTDGEDPSTAVFFAYLLILGGFFVGGYVAGRLQPNTPLIHGAIAAALAYLALQGAFVVRRLLADESVAVLGILFLTLLVASCGMGGGLLASWRHSRRIDRTSEERA